MSNYGYPPWPGQFDPHQANPYPNPQSTNPAPMPTGYPVGTWFAPEAAKLAWLGTGSGIVTGSLQSAVWWSPVFDLRPEIRGAGPSSPNPVSVAAPGGTQTNVGTQKLWRPMGAGGQLFVTIDNLIANVNWLTGLVVNMRERMSPSNPAMQVVTTPQDITSYFMVFSPQDAIQLVFGPMGYPYPIRFWQVAITFDKLSAAGPSPDFRITAAYM